MKVKAKLNNRFLIKDEWYKVISTTDEIGNKNPYKSISYQLENHTNKIWSTNWYHEINFYTLDEVRDMKLEEILNT